VREPGRRARGRVRQERSGPALVSPHERTDGRPHHLCVAVTGAAGGIGSQVAYDVAAGGRHVWCMDRDVERLAEAVARAREVGQADGMVLDITDEAAVASAFRSIGDACGDRLDGLVNAAGIIAVGSFDSFEPAQWERVFRVNVVGSYLTIKHAIPLLRAARPGRVVNVASIAGKIAGPYTAPYNASKAAVISLTRSAALGLAPDVLVNSVCPGPLDTPMYEQLNAGLDAAGAPPAFRFAQRSTVSPLGRAGTVAEISAVILFLLSDAAGFVTGEDVNASGGMVMY
jgi:NAD(P)-dependent dehydrogenase (short-subunit alcohol dehydrogenase family)